MNYRILTLSVIVLAVVFSSCKKLFEDEELSMKRTNYTGTELRTDGYYYSTYHYYDEREDAQYDKFIPWILYRNGVSLYGYVYDYSEMKKVEQSFEDGSFYDRHKDDKTRWEVFQISGSVIEFEGWESNGLNLTSDTRCGEILNDTTFRINKYVYHFKQFAPKPDSTNRFIK